MTCHHGKQVSSSAPVLGHVPKALVPHVTPSQLQAPTTASQVGSASHTLPPRPPFPHPRNLFGNGHLYALSLNRGWRPPLHPHSLLSGRNPRVSQGQPGLHFTEAVAAMYNLLGGSHFPIIGCGMLSWLRSSCRVKMVSLIQEVACLAPVNKQRV